MGKVGSRPPFFFIVVLILDGNVFFQIRQPAGRVNHLRSGRLLELGRIYGLPHKFLLWSLFLIHLLPKSEGEEEFILLEFTTLNLL